MLNYGRDCNNPLVFDLLKRNTSRTLQVYKVKPRIKGKRLCAWCLSDISHRMKNAEYCNDVCRGCLYDCFNNRSKVALLLMRQDLSCLGCGEYYGDLIEDFDDKHKEFELQHNRRILSSIVDFIYRQNQGEPIWCSTPNDVKLKECLHEINKIKFGKYSFEAKVHRWVNMHGNENIDKQKRINLEIDHVIPLAAGGLSHDDDNLQVLCYDCHKIKTKQDIITIYDYKRNLKIDKK